MSSVRKRSVEEEKAAAEKKKLKVTQPQRPHYGLYNQGATCYLNSVLQVLFMTTEIHDRLDPTSQITDQELKRFFEKLKKTTCGTEKITQRLEIKNVNQQGDAAECLELILRKVSPQVSEVFQGQLTYTTKCSKGHSINEETNPFWTLPLSLKDAHDTTYSVGRGFERIFQTKSFSGDNMVFCNECKKKTKATSGCEMVEFPRVLIVLLKRFDFDYNAMSLVKSDCFVDVPRVLQRKNKRYKLYGMVNHMGSLRGGHYTATILCNEDKTWYEFDDAHVKQVKEQPFAERTTCNSSTAYLLVYRASGSLGDKMKDPQDEQTGNKVEDKRHFRQREADNKETRQNQESQGQMRKEGKNEALRHQGRGEEGGAKRGRVSSFNEETIKTIKEDSLLRQKQNTSYSGTQHPEKRKQRSEGDKDENCPQPCSSANIMKNPLWISLIVAGCVIIVILIVILTTLT